MRILFMLFFALSFTALADERRLSSVTIERGACYGTCPVYSMTLFSDGTYFWVGGENVKIKGHSYGKISTAIFDRAMNILDEVEYLKFSDSYYSKENGCKEFWTDNPTVHISVQTPSSIKEINHYHGCRGFHREAELGKLELQIDELFETSKWVSGR